MKCLLNCILVVFVLLITSCTKEILVDLNDARDKLVIEGNITDQPGPYIVKLSRTVSFSDSNAYPPVENAVVTISDNTGILDTLIHIGNGNYQTKNIVGTSGRSYNLTVIDNGVTYLATTQMPSKVNLDSLSTTIFNFGNEERIIVIPSYIDPSLSGNNYRFIQKINGNYDGRYYAYNDNVNNGKRNQRPLIQTDLTLKTGDMVEVEMQNVDRATYDYFYTLSQLDAQGPAGGTTPSNPPSNLSGGALGYFSAHTTETLKLTIR